MKYFILILTATVLIFSCDVTDIAGSNDNENYEKQDETKEVEKVLTSELEGDIVYILKADLISEETSAYYPYNVDVNNNGELIFSIKNQGFSDSAPSTTRIILYMNTAEHVVDFTTPLLEPGESFETSPIAPPVGWYNPDGDFKIIADYNDDVDEMNENNNESTGTIIG